MIRASQFVAITLASYMFSACDTNRRPESNVDRDSAGVRITHSSTPRWSQGKQWQIESEPVLRIETPDGGAHDQSPLDPVSVYQNSRGEVVVADGNQVGWHRILVYDRSGRFLRALGRQGRGPCEFQQLWWARPYPGDSIAVFDMGAEVVQVLDLAKGCGPLVPIPRSMERKTRGDWGGYTATAYDVYPDGSFLVAPAGFVHAEEGTGSADYRHELVRVARDGRVIKRLGEFRIGKAYLNREKRYAEFVEYTTFAQQALFGWDLIYGVDHQYRLMRYDSAGTLKQIFSRDWRPEAVTRDDQELFLTRSAVAPVREHSDRPKLDLDQRIADTRWSETKPPYSNLLIDPLGFIWVEDFRLDAPDLLVDRRTVSRWSIFDHRGIWLGTVELPAQFFLQSISSDLLYGIWQDDDGVRSVRAYRLKRRI